MWSLASEQSNIVRESAQRCRNRLRVNTYRTRNPLETVDILFPLSFLFVPGARTQAEMNKNIGFKTISTPRGVTNAEGLAIILEELSAMTFDLNIIVVNTINNKEVGDEYCEYLKTTGATVLSDYTVALTQSPFHRVQMVYEEVTQNERLLKNYYLFTNKMNDVAVARLAGCMCAHMNLFKESTRQIANALLSGNQASYSELVTQYAATATAELFKEQLKNTLEQMQGYGSARTVRRLERSIQTKQNDIESYNNALKTQYDELRNLRRRLLAVQHEAEHETELKEFLTANENNITYARLADGHLYMRYRTPLLYWDEDIFNILRNSTNSNPIKQGNAEKQQLIDDIFSTRKVTLWLDSGFKYGLDGDESFAHRYMEHEFNDVPPAKGLPNPHHYYYNCWGDNEPAISRAQYEGNHVIAFAQIFAAIAGINLSDNTVLRRFVEDMLEQFRNTPCLELNDTHELISISEYYRRYHNQQQQ